LLGLTGMIADHQFQLSWAGKDTQASNPEQASREQLH
jgi:hypothetical protein